MNQSVLAAGAVQCDPGAVVASCAEILDGAFARIEGFGIDAAATERGEHRVAREQRYFALRGVPAEQHGDLAEFARVARAADAGMPREEAHAASPTMRTSGCSMTL